MYIFPNRRKKRNRAIKIGRGGESKLGGSGELEEDLQGGDLHILQQH